MNADTLMVVFSQRDTESSIEEIFRKTRQQLPFDLILLSSTGTYVQAHYFMMVMFSEYIRKFFNKTTRFQFGVTVPLKQFSHAVLHAVVKFISDGNVFIRRVIQDEFLQALNFLKIEADYEIHPAESNDLSDDDISSTLLEDDDVMIISATNEIIEIPSSDDEQTNDNGEEVPLSGEVREISKEELPLSGSSCTSGLNLPIVPTPRTINFFLCEENELFVYYALIC